MFPCHFLLSLLKSKQNWSALLSTKAFCFGEEEKKTNNLSHMFRSIVSLLQKCITKQREAVAFSKIVQEGTQCLLLFLKCKLQWKRDTSLYTKALSFSLLPGSEDRNTLFVYLFRISKWLALSVQVCFSYITSTFFSLSIQLSHILFFMQPGIGSVFLILLSAFSAFMQRLRYSSWAQWWQTLCKTAAFIFFSILMLFCALKL